MRFLTAMVIATLCILLTGETAWGQTTYTWNVSNGAWTASGSWTPTRTAPATNDILVFDGSTQASPTVTLVPAETISRLRIINNASVTFSSSTAAGGAGTIARAATAVTGTGTSFTTLFAVGDYLFTGSNSNTSVISAITSDIALTTSESGTIAAGTTFAKAPKLAITGNQPGLDIAAGASLAITSTTPIIIFEPTGATGSISGSITFSQPGHRLDCTDAGAITINSGATFTCNSSFTGNAFGAVGTANAIIFSSGSTYISGAGSNPFGFSAPNSKITFQSGSLFSHQQTGAPSFSGRTYANFELNFATATISSTGGNAFSADNFTVTAGTLNFNLTGTMNVKGSVSVAPGATLTLTPASAAAVIYSGSSPQSISGAGTLTFGPNAGITVNGAGILLSRPIALSGVLTLTSGTITTTSTNLLTLSPTGSVSGGSSTSFVNGPIAHTVASTSSTAKTFPIGKGAAYRPVTLTVTQDAATATAYTAEVFNAVPTIVTLPGTLDRLSTVRYANIAKGTGANVTTASLTLNYDTDDGVTDAANLRIAKDNGAGNWVDLGGSGSAPTTGNITSANNFTTFSNFALANNTGGGNPLPIQLASFTGHAVNGTTVQLTWRTLTEVNNYGFYVQRRMNGSSIFADLASSFVPGHGTTIEPHDYSFVDNTIPSSGIYHYRLRQIDLDGSVHYSEPITVDLLTLDVKGLAPREFALLQNYPNPFNPSTEIKFSVEQNGLTTLKIFNILGQEVATLFNEVAEAGQYYKVKLDANTFASGMYFYKLESGQRKDLKKMLLLK